MENLNTIKHWKPLCPLTGNGFFYGRIGCLDENTKIDVVENYFVVEKKLKELPNKFTVLSVCKKTRRRKHTEAIKINSGIKECYQIYFKTKSIIASEDHVFFDKDFNEVKVKDLKVGMKLKAKIKPYLVRKIEKIGKRKTYDLHVPEYNNFYLSNGVLSHNSGKSFKMKALCEYYYERNYKIWDMFGGKRGEGSFWCFPSDELKMWREYEKEVGMMKTYGPKEYNVNLVYPYFEEELPEELPQKKPRISSTLMTIYFKDITIQDISYVIGQVQSNAKYVWNYVCKNLPDDACGQNILELFEDKKMKRYKDLVIYKNFIKPMCDNKILVGKNHKHLLDLKKEATDRKTVFVLCDDYIPNSFKFFIMGYLIRNMFDLVKKDKIHKYNIALFREMSLFMKVLDSVNQDEQQTQNFRNLISDIARYARSGLYIFGDTQSPKEVRGLVEGQDDLLCISEMPSAQDREAACEQLRKDRRISTGQVAYIATMPVHELIVIERGKKAIRVRRVQPPRTKCWTQQSGNFETVWKKTYNEYQNIKDIKKEMNELYSNARTVELEEEILGEGEENDQEENEDDFVIAKIKKGKKKKNKVEITEDDLKDVAIYAPPAKTKKIIEKPTEKPANQNLINIKDKLYKLMPRK